MRIGLSIEGNAQLLRALNELPTRLSRTVVREALREGAELIRAQATAAAPRAPGAPDLADNIRIGNARPEDGSIAVAVGPTRGFYYGYFQEFGTAHHAAQPFMRPAFDSEQGRALRAIQSAMWDAVIRRGGGTRGRSSGGGLL